MNNNVFYSADYRNDDVDGLFDRIINIRFQRKDETFFTLRSDYEPIWSQGRLKFKTCQPKPEIRVTYTQYQKTLINVDIYITNFKIIESSQLRISEALRDSGISAVTTSANQGLDTNQPNDALFNKGNPITSAEIEMGYRANFHNWSQDQGTAFTDAQKYAAFQELRIPSMTEETSELIETQKFFHQYRKCTVQVEWAVNTSNPPDRVTQFHCYVGDSQPGFQPFAMQPLDSKDGEGRIGKITKTEIRDSLDDEYQTIDKVEVEQTNEEKTYLNPSINNILDSVADNDSSGQRNFFNGGNAFTLFEGYCFHMVTRRFIKKNTNVTRSSMLEQAALEYMMSTEYGGSESQLIEKKAEIEQIIYKNEKEFEPKYFVAAESGLKFSATASKVYQEQLAKKVTAVLIERYVGARYVIKWLPGYRKLYIAIRQTLKEAYLKKILMSWWDAAENITESALKTIAAERPEVAIKDDINSARQYMLDHADGLYKDKDCYLFQALINDWIIPLQRSENAETLKDSRGFPIPFTPPSTATTTGFTGAGKENTVKCFAGLLEVRDAYMFGLPVLCSKKASKVFKAQHAGSSTVEFSFHKDPQKQIEWICARWGLQYYKMHNGGFFIYETSESARGVAGEDFVTQQASKPFKIPAVYDITLTPIRKLRMPFMGFLDPMTTIEWNSTATIGEMISFYFQPDKGKNYFSVISNEVDFSTTGDQNTMTLNMVDTQWVGAKEVPLALLTQDTAKLFIDVIIIPDEQTNTWRKIHESPITKIPAQLIMDWILSDTVPSKNASGDLRVSNYQYFNLLRAWNPSLFAESVEAAEGWMFLNWFNRIDKQADKIYGKARDNVLHHFPDISYCAEQLADNLKRVYLRFPLMPEMTDYADMKEYDHAKGKRYVLVYEAGFWELRLKTTVKKRFLIGEG